MANVLGWARQAEKASGLCGPGGLCRPPSAPRQNHCLLSSVVLSRALVLLADVWPYLASSLGDSENGTTAI